jgi:hypothetical protein
MLDWPAPFPRATSALLAKASTALRASKPHTDAPACAADPS